MARACELGDHRSIGGGAAITLLLLLVTVVGAAQQLEQAPAGPETKPTAAPTPLPVASIPERAERSVELASAAAAEATAAADLTEFSRQVETMSRRVSDLADETTHRLDRSSSRSELEDLPGQWQRLESALDRLGSELSERTKTLDRLLAELQEESNLWRLTSAAAGDENLPRSVRGAMGNTVASLEEAAGQVQAARGSVLTLQTEAARITTRALGLRDAVEQRIEDQRRRTFAFDRPPLWAVRPGAASRKPLLESVLDSHRRSVDAVLRYVTEEGPRVALHGMVLVALLGLALPLRRQAREWAHEDVSLQATLRMLERPFSTALLLAVVVTGAVHPTAPMAWNRLLVLLMLVAMLRLLPRVMPARLRPGIYILVVLFLLDRVLFLVPEEHLTHRLALLALSFVVGASLLWLTGMLDGRDSPRADRWIWTIVRGGRLGALAMAVAVVANLLGAVTLATVLTEGVLTSATAAILLWAAARLVTGMVTLLLHTPAVQLLNMVRHRAETIRRTARVGITHLAVIGWVAATLDGFGMLRWAAASVKRVLTVRLTVGDFAIEPFDLLLFGVAVWASFKISKLLRFVLQEDVLPRVQLPRGVPGAVSKGTHYIVLLVGFLVAAAMAGLQLDRFALIAGALGVGIGFGLQNIVNNFVSGLILLFERPIQVGDTIQLGTLGGKVKEIGMRASVVSTWEGAEVIVPNANLISNELVNWTLSDVTRRVDVRVGVAYGNDPQAVLELLLGVAREHPDVLNLPEPVALFLGFGDSSLDFELRAWTADSFVRVGSELRVAVNRALGEAEIEIPFPQRDLHLRSGWPAASRGLRAAADLDDQG